MMTKTFQIIEDAIANIISIFNQKLYLTSIIAIRAYNTISYIVQLFVKEMSL